MKTSQAGIEPIEDELLPLEVTEVFDEDVEDFLEPEDYEDYSPSTNVLPVTGKF